ncbi:YceI family protein [uncultured Algibacter sp.]|uniref:YceI family protein n=1 Tax=uncultured Algibacter sp. TaxID=298659 RepID=UPI003217F8D2
MSNFFILVFSLHAFFVSAQTTKWNVDLLHSKVGFSVEHMMVSETEGTFDKYDATLYSDTEDFSDLKVDFIIESASINTRNEKRDKHLRDFDFFDAEKYPSITFKGTSTKKDKNNILLITGNLTIRNVTKEVTFKGEYKGTIVKDAFGLTRAGLIISTVINRQDYGVAYNGNLEVGGLMLGNDVNISCRLSITKDKV